MLINPIGTPHRPHLYPHLPYIDVPMIEKKQVVQIPVIKVCQDNFSINVTMLYIALSYLTYRMNDFFY